MVMVGPVLAGGTEDTAPGKVTAAGQGRKLGELFHGID
jgi:hypothetical protein